MSARRIGLALCIAVLCASGTYVFVYLYRWEWNRALISAAFFLAAEVALGIVAVLDRLRALQTEVQGLRSAVAEPDPAVVARLRETAPEPSTPFAWLAPDEGRMGVFVPVLMGAGVVLSAVAWLVERLAKATARPTLERRLAARLGALALPEGGLLPAGRRPPSVLDLR